MSEVRVVARPMSRWIPFALAAMAVWLLLQNSLLLMWMSSQHLEPLFIVARVLAKVGLKLLSELWMLPVAVVLGVALALTGIDRGAAAERAQGVSHV